MNREHQFQILLNTMIAIENGSTGAAAKEEFQQEARDALVKAGLYIPRSEAEEVRREAQSIANFQRQMAMNDFEKRRRVKRLKKDMEH